MNEVCFAGMEELNEERSSSEKSRIRIGRVRKSISDAKVRLLCARSRTTRPFALTGHAEIVRNSEDYFELRANSLDIKAR